MPNMETDLAAIKWVLNSCKNFLNDLGYEVLDTEIHDALQSVDRLKEKKRSK